MMRAFEVELQFATVRLKSLLRASCSLESRVVIARYTAAVGNFIAWLSVAANFVRHERSRCVLLENLRCELRSNHRGMLLSFARKCDALPNRDDYGYVSGEVEAVWTLLREPVFAGLRGLAVVAVLEHLSLTFIPELGRRAEECGCEDFTYIQTHGEADVAHSIALIEAVRVEMGEGYQSAESIVQEAMRVAEDLVTNVFY